MGGRRLRGEKRREGERDSGDGLEKRREAGDFGEGEKGRVEAGVNVLGEDAQLRHRSEGSVRDLFVSKQ